MIQLINAGTTNIANADLSVDPYGADNQIIGSGTLDRNESETIPAGKYYVKVFNDGLAPITVNGVSLPRGREIILEARSNDNTQRLDLTPAVSITTPDEEGAAASYYFTQPSA